MARCSILLWLRGDGLSLVSVIINDVIFARTLYGPYGPKRVEKHVVPVSDVVASCAQVNVSAESYWLRRVLEDDGRRDDARLSCTGCRGQSLQACRKQFDIGPTNPFPSPRAVFVKFY